jgi:hypothetical protein
VFGNNFPIWKQGIHFFLDRLLCWFVQHRRLQDLIKASHWHGLSRGGHSLAEVPEFIPGSASARTLRRKRIGLCFFVAGAAGQQFVPENFHGHLLPFCHGIQQRPCQEVLRCISALLSEIMFLMRQGFAGMSVSGRYNVFSRRDDGPVNAGETARHEKLLAGGSAGAAARRLGHLSDRTFYALGAWPRCPMRGADFFPQGAAFG